MKKIIVAIFCIFFLAGKVCNAAVSPSLAVLKPAAQTDNPITLSASQLEKITGRHMNFIQRLEWKFLQRKLKNHRNIDEGISEKQRHQATASLILGIGSLALLFVPYIGILALPGAILGLIFGIKSLKGNSNAKGIIGIVFSGVTLLLFLLAILLVAEYLAVF